MKKSILFLLILTATIASFVSCSSSVKNPKEPGEIAVEFTRSIHSGDFERAKSFCSEDGQKSIDFAVQMVGDERVELAKSAKPEVTIEDVYVNEFDSTATVKLLIKNGVDFQSGEIVGERTDNVYLVCENGKWQVNISK